MEFLLGSILCGFCLSAQAYTVSNNVYSTAGNAADVQAAISAAKDGAVVQLPAGSFTWSNSITVKTGVTIQGKGVSSTTLANPGTSYSLFSVMCDQVRTRITGIAFKGQYAISVGGSYTTAQFRIDDCTFDCGTVQGTLLQCGGNAPGLVDHCTFTGGSASEMIHNMGLGAANGAGWLDDVYPGSASAVYIENCTFSKNPLQDQYFWGTAALQSYYGARTVLRHSILNACHIDQHGTPGMIGARWWEFYNNTFYVPPGMSQGDYFALRGGSGVVFNNVVTGSNNVSGAIELYDENGGPTPLYLARGIDQNYSPVYIWNNNGMSPWSGSSNVIAGRDYFVSSYQPSSMIKRQLTTDTANTTYSYTPYVYPHPLDDGSTSVFGPR